MTIPAPPRTGPKPGRLNIASPKRNVPRQMNVSHARSSPKWTWSKTRSVDGFRPGACSSASSRAIWTSSIATTSAPAATFAIAARNPAIVSRRQASTRYRPTLAQPTRGPNMLATTAPTLFDGTTETSSEYAATADSPVTDAISLQRKIDSGGGILDSPTALTVQPVLLPTRASSALVRSAVWTTVYVSSTHGRPIAVAG
jgi:hypothetical protein